MNRCQKCSRPSAAQYFCPKCNTVLCQSCYIKSHSKCPSCNALHMVRAGGIEDQKLKKASGM